MGGSFDERSGWSAVTVLIDPPSWPAHGRRWSHLVSDTSLAELHAFARRLGIPERGFEGDHYDLPEERYADAVRAGAQPVSGRELLRRLQASGLRRPKRRGEQVLASTHPADGVRVDTLQSAREPSGPVDAVILAVRRPGDLLVLADGDRYQLPRATVTGTGPDAVHRASSERFADLLGDVPGAGAPVQLGYLRTVTTVPGRTELVPTGFAVVWSWSVDGGLPRMPALWCPQDSAEALLPDGLAPLLRRRPDRHP